MYSKLVLQQKLDISYSVEFADMGEFVEGWLRAELTGKWHEKYGYIQAVGPVTIVKRHYGVGLNSDEMTLHVQFEARVFRPYRNEVIDGTVLKVTKVGLFVACGPLLCFLSRQVFPEDVEFTYGDSDSGLLKSDFSGSEIKEGSTLHLMIIGMRQADDAWFGIVTLATAEDDEMDQQRELNSTDTQDR